MSNYHRSAARAREKHPLTEKQMAYNSTKPSVQRNEQYMERVASDPRAAKAQNIRRAQNMGTYTNNTSQGQKNEQLMARQREKNIAPPKVDRQEAAVLAQKAQRRLPGSKAIAKGASAAKQREEQKKMRKK